MTVLGSTLRRSGAGWPRTRLWWALLIPVAVLAVLVNLFGGLLGDGLGDTGGDFPVLPASVAFTLTLTAVFAAVYGTVTAAGEFRHRTVTTAYLTAGGRGRVLVGKLVAGACVGALYALVAVLVGVALGVLGQGAGRVSGAERWWAWPPWGSPWRRCGARSARPWACCSRTRWARSSCCWCTCRSASSCWRRCSTTRARTPSPG